MSNWGQSLVLSAEHLKADEIGRGSGKVSTLWLYPNVADMPSETSPDPALTGVLFAQTIQGIQSSGVIANAKHYIGNEQEHFRQAPEAAGFGFNISDSLSSNIDDVTMHELYLW